MIDWLSFVAPCGHLHALGGPFYAGNVMSFVPDVTRTEGYKVEFDVLKRKSFEGSYSSTITVKSQLDENGRSCIFISGNPAKWFQGHNIFGSDDLHGLVIEMLHRVCKIAGHVPSPNDVLAWQQGVYKLVRVDVTQSFDLGNLARVRNALRSMDATDRKSVV